MRKTKKYKRKRRNTRKRGGLKLPNASTMMNQATKMASNRLKNVPSLNNARQKASNASTSMMNQARQKALETFKQNIDNNFKSDYFEKIKSFSSDKKETIQSFIENIKNNTRQSIDLNLELDPEHKKILDLILANKAIIVKIIQDKDFNPEVLINGDETQIKNMIFGIISKNPTIIMKINLSPLIKK